MTRIVPLPTKTALIGLLQCHAVAGAAAEALDGDFAASSACVDYLIEQGDDMVPFAIGERHLIQTETLYWVGEIVAVSGSFLVLDHASWVHWTGRLGVLVANKSFADKKWSGQRPRTEYVGRVIVSLSKIVDSIPGDWDLPEESITS